MLLRLTAAHRPGLLELLRATPEFNDDDVAVALELIDLGLAGSADYRFWVDAGEGGQALGYICFGPTPMTRATHDLYWIAVDQKSRNRGAGRALVAKMEQELLEAGGALVRVETASSDAYLATRAFYERIGYRELARIRDFYWKGNDLVIYGHYLGD